MSESELDRSKEESEKERENKVQSKIEIGKRRLTRSKAEQFNFLRENGK